jgi:uncharacterized delta-60 repeat protein
MLWRSWKMAKRKGVKGALAKRAGSFCALALLATNGFGAPVAGPATEMSKRAGLIERPQAAGDLDPTFGVNGLQTTDFFSDLDWAFGVGVQSDGKIVAAGSAQHSLDPASSDFAVARYNPDGTPDQGFGSAGKQTTDFFGNYDQADSVAIQPDGKVVLAGYAQRGNDRSTADFALARYNPDGSLDQTFGSGGKQSTDFFGDQDQAAALAIQPDGKIVEAGFAQNRSAADFALARYSPDGTLDQSFGSAGRVTTTFSGTADVLGVLIQPDGKIVAAGYSLPAGSSNQRFALARYNTDGTLDQSFGSGGKQTTDFFGHVNVARAVAIQTDGKIIAAGLAWTGAGYTTSDFALAGYNADGSLDQTFGSGGKQTTDFFSRSDEAHGIAIQSDGKIVLAGSAQDSDDTSNSDFALARYNRDGTLDQSFGSGGKQTTDFFGGLDSASGVAIQPDGKIVLAGYASHTREYSTFDFGLARYTVAPDFSIAFTPSAVPTPAGSKVRSTLVINRIGGFSGNVTVTAPEPSMGIKPKPLDPLTISGDRTVLKLKVADGVSPGSYDRVFTATDDMGRTRAATLTIVVQ